MNVLDYEDSVEAIDALPNTEIIVGSPPCVSFSFSNKAGKADKSLGIRLIESYLRVVAVKKHRPGSILKAWLMENVPNSRNYVKPAYTFEDLNLGEWAKKVAKKNPKEHALWVQENGSVLCAADYGSAQKRERFVCGEIVKTGEFPEPEVTHEVHTTLGSIKDRMPKPHIKAKDIECEDPNYPELKLKACEITNHFYDTGLYATEWESAKFAKVNHPFMGRMSFPEAEDRTSRTIMATRSGGTRESLVYKSEWGHKGDGEYRLPTIREISSLMGFPYSYQFVGSEGTKWKQIGNAVCPHMSAALGREIRKRLGLPRINKPRISAEALGHDPGLLNDLNSFSPKSYGKPPKRKSDSKFRRHTFKSDGITVALMNHDPADRDDVPGRKWRTVVFVGSGKSYTPIAVPKRELPHLSKLISTSKYGKGFLKDLEDRILPRVSSSKELQRLLAEAIRNQKELGPTELVNEIGLSIQDRVPVGDMTTSRTLGRITGKETLHTRQLFTMYAFTHVTEGHLRNMKVKTMMEAKTA